MTVWLVSSLCYPPVHKSQTFLICSHLLQWIQSGFWAQCSCTPNFVVCHLKSFNLSSEGELLRAWIAFFTNQPCVLPQNLPLQSSLVSIFCQHRWVISHQSELNCLYLIYVLIWTMWNYLFVLNYTSQFVVWADIYQAKFNFTIFICHKLLPSENANVP